MAVQEPFIRRLFVKHPLKFCRDGGFFYMETGCGARVIVAAAVDNGANHLYYRAASTSAAMFAEEAEEFYKITAAKMMENIVDDYLQLPMMEKLNEPKECRVNLKVYNYSYGGIDQCKFNIVSIFHDTTESIVNAPCNPQLLAPTKPAKKAKITNYAGPSSPANNQEEDSDESATMQDASDGEDTDSLSKKND